MPQLPKYNQAMTITDSYLRQQRAAVKERF